MKAQHGKVQVSERALLQRINRRLKAEDECIKKTRGGGGNGRQDLGDYYKIDFNHNAVVDSDVDLEGLGKKLGVLQGFEALKKTT